MPLSVQPAPGFPVAAIDFDQSAVNTGGYYNIFATTTVTDGKGSSSFGFNALWDSGLTSGSTPVSAVIKPFSGNEDRINNNFLSFPRSAWECSLGRSSGPSQRTAGLIEFIPTRWSPWTVVGLCAEGGRANVVACECVFAIPGRLRRPDARGYSGRCSAASTRLARILSR